MHAKQPPHGMAERESYDLRPHPILSGTCAPHMVE